MEGPNRWVLVVAPAHLVNGGKPLTLAVFSCARYQDGMRDLVYFPSVAYAQNRRPIGYFNAYGVAAHNTSTDIFVHLGDYVCRMRLRWCASL